MVPKVLRKVGLAFEELLVQKRALDLCLGTQTMDDRLLVARLIELGVLSFGCGKVGEVLVAQGKLQEALEACQQSLAIAKRLAEQDKTNSGWQRDLIGNW